MKHRIYLDENLKPVGVSLTEDDPARINRAFPPGLAPGDRHNPGAMTALNSQVAFSPAKIFAKKF